MFLREFIASPSEPGKSRRIPMSSPDVGSLEEAYVLDAIRSGWVAPVGPHADAFEEELAARCERAYAVVLSSGTAALHLALLEVGVGPGTLVLVPTLTFVATANAVTYTGATPVFIDGDPISGNMSPELVEKAMVTLKAEGEHVGAVVTVDLLGRCADHEPIMDSCRRYNVPLVEDAAEALGARGPTRPAGAYGEASVLSFNGNKIMTTSGGGAVLTDDHKLARRVRHLSTQAREPVKHYEHEEVGFNYRMSNVAAAIGRGQLERLDGMMDRRRAMRAHYRGLFDGVPGVSIFQGVDDERDNCWLTAILVHAEEAGWSPHELAKVLENEDIESRPLWNPMHRQPVFEGARSFVTGVSDRLVDTGLALPSGSALTTRQVEHLDSTIRGFLDGSL